MNPVTVTITDERELGGYQRARCHNLTCGIYNLADLQDLGDIIDAVDYERLPELVSLLEAARAWLEAIHAQASPRH